ncbi:MAG: hypothetical protein K1Y01_05720 [Vicinamibacteria bacterium]|nr:hypothetical protein [Vicinamibacteria bacterium]
MTTEEQDAFDALCAYTLTRRDATFIHQHAVDAFAAQHADESTKPIRITFALVGLFLMTERQVSGKQVQRIHMQLGQRRETWPRFALPASRGTMTAIDVMKAPEGAERDAAIHAWGQSVWAAYSESREGVAALLRERGIIR